MQTHSFASHCKAVQSGLVEYVILTETFDPRGVADGRGICSADPITRCFFPMECFIEILVRGLSDSAHLEAEPQWVYRLLQQIRF